jgi:hypothetical protein
MDLPLDHHPIDSRYLDLSLTEWNCNLIASRMEWMSTYPCSVLVLDTNEDLCDWALTSWAVRAARGVTFLVRIGFCSCAVGEVRVVCGEG